MGNRQSTNLTIAVAVVSLLSLTPSASAQSCELRLDHTALELGEAAPVELTCTNTAQPDAPTLKTPPGIELRLLSPTPSQFSQTSIINGRVSQSSTYRFNLQLTALREGTYSLGPIALTAGGQTYNTNAVAITVRKTEAAAAAKGDRVLFVEMSVSPTSLYVTESYTATLTIGIRKLVIEGREYEVDMLRQVLDLNGSQLSVFAGGSARQSEVMIANSEDRSHKYVVYRVTQDIRAEQIGEARVGPVFLKANYPTAVRPVWTGRLEFSRTTKETARADAISVTVKGPPDRDRPESFTGAIGRFTMDVSVKPSRVEQGQPVTLTVAIRGAPLEGVAGPDLARQPELVSRFDFAPEELIGDVEGDAKVFRRALFPKQTGEQTLPPIVWSYFDTQRGQYVTLTSQPLPLAVDPRSEVPSVVSLSPSTEPRESETTLTRMSGGISPNYVDPDFVLADHSFSLASPASVITFALPPMLCLVATLSTRHRARLREDVSYARRRHAARVARTAVRRALTSGTPVEQWHKLGAALSAYLSDHFGLATVQLTPTEARDLLAAQGFPIQLADQIAAFLDRCDAIRYASGLGQETSPASAADTVLQWITAIENHR